MAAANDRVLSLNELYAKVTSKEWRLSRMADIMKEIDGCVYTPLAQNLREVLEKLPPQYNLEVPVSAHVKIPEHLLKHKDLMTTKSYCDHIPWEDPPNGILIVRVVYFGRTETRYLKVEIKHVNTEPVDHDDPPIDDI